MKLGLQLKTKKNYCNVYKSATARMTVLTRGLLQVPPSTCFHAATFEKLFACKLLVLTSL